MNEDLKFEVVSYDSGKLYVVVREGRAWKCSCPHWLFRLRKQGVACKHIVQMQELVEQQDVLQRSDWSTSW